MLTTWFRRIVLTVATLALLAYLGACFAIWKWQNTLIFLPPETPLQETPAAFGIDYEDVWLTVGDDERERLHGWWLEAGNESQWVILHLHGNGDNISASLPQAEVFHRLGFDVFLIDYRGYGRSQGRDFPHEQQAYEDARVALDYLVGERAIAPEQIAVFGHSLGGAIAIELATHRPQLAGLIVQGSFTSMRDMVEHDGIYNKFFPVDLLLHQTFDSAAKLPNLDLPILLIHGGQDERIPDRMSRELYQIANEPKDFLFVPDGMHNDLPESGGRAYRDKIAEFLQLLRDRHAQRLATQS